MRAVALLLSLVALLATVSTASDSDNGLDFAYPYPVQQYRFTSQLKKFTMAYMDISPPSTTPKSTVVLLHGKNFCGATWNTTIVALLAQNYRVIVPDQVGFCKSTKPSAYQFSLFQLAQNTNGLLRSLNIPSATIMGHSMGGMLAARYALMFPTQTTRLVMVAPLGLENWFALGVPYQAIDTSYATELNTSYTSLRTYQQATYYGGKWDPSYDVPINMLLTLYNGPLRTHFAYNMAQTTDAVFTQPIIQELPNLKMPSLLIIGDLDTTAIGKAWAPASVKPLLGKYDVLGKTVSKLIPGCTLVAWADLGHAPQIQDPERFHAALLGWLG